MKCFIPNKFNFTIDYSKHDFQDCEILVKNSMFHEVIYHAYQIIETLDGLISTC